MNFLGIGSGLDLSTMLDGLVKVASQPKVQQLGNREIQVEDSISGLGILKSVMSDFQSAADALKDADLYTKKTPSLTQPASGDLISVDVDSSAVAADYDIEVVNLAKGSTTAASWRSVKYQSDLFEDTSSSMSKSGTLTFSITDLDGVDGVGANITVDSADSLEDLRDKIDALTGISAQINDGRLEYFAEGTGEALKVTQDSGLDSFINSDGTNPAGDMTERVITDKKVGISGDLIFSADGNSFSVTLDGTESLDDILEKVNGNENNIGITANIINGKLIYESSIAGDGNDLFVTGSSADLDPLASIAFGGGAGRLSVTASASDAQIKVDGEIITNDTNVFDNAISGLTITALKESPTVDGVEQTSTLKIGDNSSDVQSKIEAFASAYNKLREKMNELKGTTDEDGNFIAGKLSNDPIMRNVETVLNSLVTQQVSGADDNLDTLYAIGLQIESDGTLSTDADRLSDAVNGGISSLQKLFAGDGAISNGGLADIISDQIENYVSFTGIIKGKEDSFQEQLDDLEEQYEAHARYIESYEKTLKQQFTALDATMAQMNSVMQYIGPQLAALPGVAK